MNQQSDPANVPEDAQFDAWNSRQANNSTIAPSVTATTKRSSLPLMLGVCLVLGLVAIGSYYLGTQQQPDGMQTITSEREDESQTQVKEPSSNKLSADAENPAPSLSPVVPTANLYSSNVHGVSFALLEGERVVECVNVDKYNDVVSLRIMTGQLPVPSDPQAECATEGFPTDIDIIKRGGGSHSVSSYVEQLKKESYTIVSTPITISQVVGSRVTGTRDETIPAPLPEKIDKMLFEKKGSFYIIPSTFLQRDFAFLD